MFAHAATARRAGNVRLAFRLCLPAAVGLAALGLVRPAAAVPSFADQTGMPCQACHVGGFGPQLTTFGREFKLNGYTLRVKKFNVPIAGMAIASYNHTRADQNPPPQYLAPNDNVTLDQASVFLGGGIGQHLGGLAQVTYSGVSHQWSWDNTDVRLINQGKLFGKDATYGIDVNNNPTVQDVFNTAPAWSFPYTDQDVGNSPAAGTLINGGFAQSVVGTSVYAWIDHHVYLEGGAYSTLARGTLNWLGVDPIGMGDIHGLAPYGRIAWQHDLGKGTAHIGLMALKAAINPGRDRSTGLTDHYSDVAIDASYLLPLGKDNTFTLQARYTHEAQNLAASCTLGQMPVGCAHTSLGELRGDIAYYWHNKVGLTLTGFTITGPANTFLYSGPFARPDSNGVTAQVDYTPWGAGNSPLGPRFNVRLGAQYTAYGQFNGTHVNYDGNGARAADNNIFRVFAWMAY